MLATLPSRTHVPAVGSPCSVLVTTQVLRGKQCHLAATSVEHQSRTASQWSSSQPLITAHPPRRSAGIQRDTRCQEPDLRITALHPPPYSSSTPITHLYRFFRNFFFRCLEVGDMMNSALQSSIAFEEDVALPVVGKWRSAPPRHATPRLQ